MLTKSNGMGSDGIITSSSFSIEGFGDVFGTVSGPSGGGAVTSASNNNNMDGLLVAGTSSTIGDSVITFSPVKDAELRRRARNNVILAKIQELEANATVQAARSERLRMMREEYESLVRKYASNSKWNWGQGSSSNGFMNENNGYRQATYLGRYNAPQQPFIFAPGSSQQLLTTSGVANENAHFQPSPVSTSMLRGMAHISSNINPSFTTTGVNTDITGPVRPADVISATTPEKDNDLARSTNLKRVKVVVDIGSQTQEPPARALLSASSGPYISDGKWGNQNNVLTEKEELPTVGKGNKSKKLPMNMEMMMMLEDEDDESLLEAHERTKLQREHFHHQLKQPKGAPLPSTSHHPTDDTPSNHSSPSAVSSPLGEAASTSNTTEEVFKLRQRQQKQEQQRKKKAEIGTKSKKAFGRSEKETNDEDRRNDLSSMDTTTISLAKGPGDRFSKSVLLRNEIADLSLSDSNSVLQIEKHNLQRKRLMEELAATTALRSNRNKAEATDIGDREDTTLNDSNPTCEDDDETKEKIGFESELASQGAGESGKKKGLDNEDEVVQQCSSPTAGATSESIGDSMMDSIQKTPDTLPKDDSELQGIAVANEEEPEEIELDHNVLIARGNNAYADDDDDDSVRASDDHDDVLLVAPTSSGTVQASVNERLPNEGRISLRTGTSEEITELVVHRHHEEEEEDINDAEEIRSNNLSSSKLDVLVEEENFPHVNNPEEIDRIISSKSGNFPKVLSAFQHDAFFEREREQKEMGSEFYEDIGQPKESMFQVDERDEELHEKQILQSDSDAVNELNRKNKIYSYAPSANSPPSNALPGLNTMTGAGQTSILPPASTSFPQKQLSTASSSSSSSRQQSFEEQGDDDVGANKGFLKTMEGRDAGSEQNGDKTKDENYFPTWPQAVNSRHPELEEGIKKGNKKTSASLQQGADMMAEHFGSYLKSATNMVPDINGTKEKATTLEKTTKASGTATSSPIFPSKKGGGGSESSLADNVDGTAVNLNRSGNNEGVTNMQSNNVKAPRAPSGASPVKPIHGGGSTTTPSGITGANNTAKRFRLKFNYDDSESDSSEIGPGKTNSAVGPAIPNLTGSQQMNVGAAKSNSSSQQQRDPPTTSGGKVETNEPEKVASKKPDGQDDDFDDFFDM